MNAFDAPLTRIAGWNVVFAMAADAEYGARLKERFQPLMTGVGPVEAGVVTAIALARLKDAGDMPQLVVSLGSAGSRTLEQAEVYQATAVSYRDMDASPLGFKKGVTPFLHLPPKLCLPLRIPGVKEATLSTGGNIVNGRDYDAITADMVDMETYAVLRACHRFGVPLLALRGISDGAEDLRRVDDWTQYLHMIDEKLASAIDRLESAITNGALELRQN